VNEHQTHNDAPESTPPQGEDTSWKGSLLAHLARAWAVLEEQGAIFMLLGALALIAAGAWYAIGRNFDDWVRGLLIGGLLAIAIYILLRPQDLQRVLTGRSTRYGSNALILSVATIGIVVLVNYFSNRYHKRFDATEDNLHTLSPQSIQFLGELDREIEVIGVYPGGQAQEQFEQWLDEYRTHTDLLQYSTVDPIRQPGEADRLGWDAYGGGLLVRQDTRSQQVTTPDEQDITSALLKVSRDVSKAIYFVTGHNEPDPTDYAQAGYGQIGALLEKNNYQIQTLNLVVAEAVPADAGIIVIAGPQTPLLEEEKGRLISYLSAGGKALILIDPGEEATGINDVLAPWEVRFENKLVVDLRLSLPGEPITPVIDRYQFSQITKDLGQVALVLPLAAPIEGPAMGELGVTFTPLAMTSEQSWAETNMEEAQEARYDEGSDLLGPLTLLASLEAPAADAADEMTRLVLVGDTDFLRNEVLDQVPNGQFLLLNAVNWLAEEESLIAIGPKTNAQRRVQMNLVQEGAVCFGSLILIPAMIVVAGVVVWLRRR
jgi:ABC-type uncharacterized transport system involved in gliding motility auxiliary subunit